MEGELLDWELVHGSDTESTDSATSNNKSESSTAIDDGMILFDHFSADNPFKVPTDQTQYGVVGSGDSFPVDYRLESPNQRQNSGDLDFVQSGDACYDDGEVRLSDFEPADEKDIESQSGVEDSSKSLSDSGGNELDSGIVDGEEDIVSDAESIVGSGGNTVQVVGDVNSAVRSGDETSSRETVWWKMPFVLVKYCAFRIGPFWPLSMAAAVMGLALLGRRLHTMKKKAQRFNLKVTINDKKVAQVMSQAARLNEVFTEVRRVPVIRPTLPSPGAWPVLSLR